jgi:thioester reductase-like protein
MNHEDKRLVLDRLFRETEVIEYGDYGRVRVSTIAFLGRGVLLVEHSAARLDRYEGTTFEHTDVLPTETVCRLDVFDHAKAVRLVVSAADYWMAKVRDRVSEMIDDT